MVEKAGYIQLQIPVEDARELGAILDDVAMAFPTTPEALKLLDHANLLITKEEEMIF